MKLLDHLTSAARSDKFFRRKRTRGTSAPIRRPSHEAVGRKKIGDNAVRGKIQNFSYFAPGAKTVQLAGDFTDWQARPVSLRKGADGLWWGAVRLEAGTHHYRFLVDGQWHDDPDCPVMVPNPFGSLNAVRQV